MAYEYTTAPRRDALPGSGEGRATGTVAPGSYHDTTVAGAGDALMAAWAEYLCPLSRESCLGPYCGASVISYGNNGEIKSVRCGLASAGSGEQRPNVLIARPDGGGRR
jgi:hypothetical protein